MTEISTALGLFVIFSLIFQIIAFNTYKNELLWAWSDYVWLTVATLALITITAEARKDEARTMIHIQEDYLQTMAIIVEQDVHFSLNFANFFSGVNVVDETQEITRNKNELREMESRLLPYLKEFESNQWISNIDKFHSKDHLLKGMTDPIIQSQIEQLSDSLLRVQQAYNELTELKNKLRTTFLERLRIYLGPILLAFALAVRFAKTTAEIKRKSAIRTMC